MSGDRHSVADSVSLLTDPDEIARREAENGIRQFTLALDIIRSFVKEPERPFRLRSSLVLQLHRAALDGLHALAGTFRNTSVKIGGSGHQPPDSPFVAEEVEHLCDYVNDNWSKSAIHLASYVLWKLNWIHPFADGNGRTARAVSYVVLSIKLIACCRARRRSRNRSQRTRRPTTTRLNAPTGPGQARPWMCPNWKG